MRQCKLTEASVGATVLQLQVATRCDVGACRYLIAKKGRGEEGGWDYEVGKNAVDEFGLNGIQDLIDRVREPVA